ncbi:MAG: sigma-54 dependent transcriptional regulator [Bdellovibrionales bacterium]
MDQTLRLLVIDDDDLVLQSLRMATPNQWTLTGYNSPDEIDFNKQFDAAFVDMHLTGNINSREGLEIIQKLAQSHPHLEIVAMSGDLNRDLMEACLKNGASRFLAKPLSADEVILTLDKIEGLKLLQNASGRGALDSVTWIGNSSLSENIKKQVANLRGESGPILIEGESGTGKEVICNLIHSQGNGGPLIRINVAAIPENLFESELFGHVKGAFTGAQSNKMGLAEAAHGGDLFLDEVEALSLNHQAKLLRFLETGEVRRVGSEKPIHVKVRIIAATNRSLEDMVAQSMFREDLLWRLNGKKITLPPLRERPEDIKALCEFFLGQDSARKKTLEQDALIALTQYAWPGNVRELKRVCEQLIVIAPLPIIRADDIHPLISKNVSPSIPALNSENYSMGLSELVARFESKIISDCLNQLQDIDKVGQLLQVSRSNLYKKIKDYDIDWRK